jgi:hypothetical protein
MRGVLVGLLLLASPATAEERLTAEQAEEVYSDILALANGWSWDLVDLEAIMEQHSDEVVHGFSKTGEPMRELHFADESFIVCFSEKCMSGDPLGGGAHCLMRRLNIIRIGAEACNFPLDEETALVIEYQKKLVEFYSRNAVPPLDPEQSEALFQVAVEGYRAVLEAPYFEERIDCEELRSPDSGHQSFKAEFFEAMQNPVSVEKFEAYLRTPRLPLAAYCTRSSHRDIYDPD